MIYQPPYSVGCGLRNITLLCRENWVESLRDLARVLRAQQRERTADLFGSRKISPSAELMVDPRSGLRCAIRDTRDVGRGRYHWTVTVIGGSQPVATGRAGDIAAARSQAAAALGAYSAEEREQQIERNGTDG